jgi:hypothetical protein
MIDLQSNGHKNKQTSKNYLNSFHEYLKDYIESNSESVIIISIIFLIIKKFQTLLKIVSNNTSTL